MPESGGVGGGGFPGDGLVLGTGHHLSTWLKDYFRENILKDCFRKNILMVI